MSEKISSFLPKKPVEETLTVAMDADLKMKVKKILDQNRSNFKELVEAAFKMYLLENTPNKK